MKKGLSLLLVLILCLSCAGCGGSAGNKTEPASPSPQTMPKHVQQYLPGITMDTDFGSIAVLDAAFCAKAQIFYTVSTRTSKTTVNGKTTESHTETIHPGYRSAIDGKLVFALRTVMTNNTDADIDLLNLRATVSFAENTPLYFSKGGNVHISDEAYKTLPAGSSAEIIFAALVPVEQYTAASECLFEIGGTSLGFSYGDINIYDTLGFQEGDNTTVPIDVVIQAAQNVAPVVTETPTEPEETEPPIETSPGTYDKTGGTVADGRALTIANVSIGFRDQLPSRILESRSFSHYADKLTLNDTQVYAVISFTATNLTGETIDLADIHDDFMVQLKFNNKYNYNTNSDVYAVFESDGNCKAVRRSSTNGFDISVSPLASSDVTLYLPCARAVQENPDKPLTVTFLAKYSGSESFAFSFQRTAPAVDDTMASMAYIEKGRENCL